MGIRIYYIILLFLLVPVFAGAQDASANYDSEYIKAKQFYDAGRFGLAQDTFEKLINESPGNAYPVYASYYYALSAYQQGYLALSRDMFLQLKVRYPGWEQMEEVNYWLSLISFENGNPFLALQYSQEIRDLADQVKQMQQFYLQKINDLDTMLSLLEEYPNSYTVGEQTAYLITQQNFLERDLDLLDSLSEKFNLPFLSERDRIELGPKDRYTVSLLFPFLSSELKPDLSPKVNQFVLDLYQGIMLAADSLNKMSSPFDFVLFDTGRDTSVVKGFFTDNRLRESDLIIGPLYNPEIISDFSIQHRVNVLHPYLKDDAILTDNPYYFLYSTLPSDLGLKAASLALEDTTMKKALVFYGDSDRDSIMNQNFLDAVDSTHLEVVLSKKILLGEEREALRVLTSESVVNKLTFEEIILPYDSIDLIYVASNNPGGSVYSNILTGVEARGDSIPVLGSRNWVEDNVVAKEVLERLNVTMTTYDFINFTDSIYSKFSDKYLNRYGSLPTKFSAVGFDMMMFFGSSIQKYGKYFQLGLRKEGYVQGFLSAGYDYSASNSNRLIPVIKWDGGKMVLVESLMEKEEIADEESKEQEK